MKKIIIVVIFIMLASCISAFADTVVFKSGKKVEGTIKSVSDTNIIINLYDVTEMTYDISEVAEINGEPVKQKPSAEPKVVNTVIPETSITFHSSEEAIQKFKQAGLPTSIGDLIPNDIPDSENGAIIYRKAFKILESLENKYKNEWKYISNPKEYDNATTEEKKIFSSFMLNDPDFEELSRTIDSASKLKCQYVKKCDQDPQWGLLAIDQPYLLSTIRCAGIISVKSQIETSSGMNDKAIQDAALLFGIPKSIQDDPSLVSQLARMSLNIMAVDNLNKIVNSLEIKKDNSNLIYSRILSEREDKKIRAGIKADAVSFIVVLESFKKEAKKTNADEFNKMLKQFAPEHRPDEALVDDYNKDPKKFWDNQETIYLDVMYKAISYSTEPYYKVSNALANLDSNVSKLSPNEAFYAKSLIPAFQKVILQEAKVNAYLELAEIGLSNKLYKDKYGKYVDSLSQLTPEFLQKVPLDPFTGKDYIYKKMGEGFSVYSVSVDLKDDGGEVQGFPSGDKGDIVWIVKE